MLRSAESEATSDGERERKGGGGGGVGGVGRRGGRERE
jgi:hypothetical protein